MKILVSGSSGLIGSTLVDFLNINKQEVFKLVRTSVNLNPNEIAWDTTKGMINSSELEGIDAVVHLAGENIAKGRWTEAKKKRILDSRVIGTQQLCEALASLKKPPKVLVSASAIGYYGNRGNEFLTEESSEGSGFIASVCKQWEAATKLASEKGIRVVNLRIGVILTPKGGALQQMLMPFRLGLGGQIGSGQQYISWIAIDDLIRVIHETIQNEKLRGPINGVGPNPVTNKEFTQTLGRVLQRPTFLQMPEFMARTIFGQIADEILLSSVRAIPKALEEQGFKFEYPNLEEALRYLLEKSV